MYGGIGAYAFRGAVGVACVGIGVYQRQLEEIRHEQSGARARQSHQPVSAHHGCHLHGCRQRFEHEEGLRVALGERHVGYGQRYGPEIHRHDGYLSHGHHGRELAAVEHRHHQRQSHDEQREHGCHDEQRHLYLSVGRELHGLVVVVDGRQARKVVGLHRREHHARVGYRKHESRVI